MRKFTERELWAFVNRAETPEQIRRAAYYITFPGYLDLDHWAVMMDTLARKIQEQYIKEARA